MLKKMSLLLSSGVLVMAALPISTAMAAAPMGFAGNAAVSYGNTTCDGCDDVDNWSVGGSGAFGLGMGDFAGQIDGSFTGVSASGSDLNLWGIGGSVFWAPAMGRAGLNIHYNTADEEGVDFDLTRYGVFGEYFVSDYFTVGAKGGGLSATLGAFGFSESESGYYLGGALTGYAMPNLAIQGKIDHVGISDADTDATNYGIGLEFLVSETVPIAIFGGYTHTETEVLGFSGDADSWLIGVRIYTNGNGVTLVERHRNGAVGSIGALDTNSLISGF